MPSRYDRFSLVTDFELRGDQSHAIDELVEGLNRGDRAQVLLGVTGSGKTFTMAQCIARVNRPTLVMELFGDEVDELITFDALTGKTLKRHDKIAIYPKTHFVTPRERTKRAVETIKAELEWYRAKLESEGKVLEAHRLHQRTMFDLEMIKEIGYCHGIENYARHLTGRAPGEPPPTLLDYLPSDALTIVDESHQTVPQIRGMYNGDRSRKEELAAYGFRLPSALDNRPLNFEEWEARVRQVVFVSATPGPYELSKAGGVVVEQVIRP